jgi:hypothetical protein
MPVRIEEPEAPLIRVHLRWRAAVPERWRNLNDQWERSYARMGDAGAVCFFSLSPHSLWSFRLQ